MGVAMGAWPPKGAWPPGEGLAQGARGGRGFIGRGVEPGEVGVLLVGL